VVLELTVSGSSWGRGPRATIHSSAASLVDSPPFRLAQALATLTDTDGRGCKVKGLAEVMSYRKPLDPEERELIDRLAHKFSGKDWRDVLPVGGAANVDALVGGSEGTDPLINFLYGPTFNIAGLRSGFLGPETSTIPYVVPHAATASLDIRMVVELTPEEIIASVRKHLDAHGFEDIEIEVFSATSHHQTPLNHPYVQAVRQTLKDRQVETTIWPIEAGGGPWTVVPNALGVPCLRGGVVGGGSRAGEEYMVIEGDGKVAGLAEVEQCHVDLLFAFARQAEALTEAS
jgi:acetylornithine deacetylase/succinyl-diaminopimelate desuccinylase-like protein